MAKDDGKMLTVKFPLQTLAEFAAAAEISRARTVSELISVYVRQTINTVRSTTPADEWNAVVKAKMDDILARSEARTKKHASQKPVSSVQQNLDSETGPEQNTDSPEVIEANLPILGLRYDEPDVLESTKPPQKSPSEESPRTRTSKRKAG